MVVGPYVAADMDFLLISVALGWESGGHPGG